MKKVFFLAIIFIALTLSSCDTDVNSENYQTKVMELYDYEALNTTQFLSADGTYREGFWGDKFVVNCTINNNAKISSFKDVSIRVTYYSATKSVIGTEDYVIYKEFLPQREKTIELEIKNYKDVESIGWEVIGAIGFYK